MGNEKTFAQTYLNFQEVDWEKMKTATIETLSMTLESLIVVVILGLCLGLLLFYTKKKRMWWSKISFSAISVIVNTFRSIPFIILIVLLLPFTAFVVGTTIGPAAALPALIISAAPFYARMVEIAFNEIDHGVLEAAEAMGANKAQVIFKVLIPESLPALVSGITVTAISLVGFTAMAGAIGAGGLGNLAYLDGFQGNKMTITLVATIIILVIVFIMQGIGDFIVKRIDKR